MLRIIGLIVVLVGIYFIWSDYNMIGALGVIIGVAMQKPEKK